MTETLLALTIFRDDFGWGFVVAFAWLTLLKSWHWILAGRIDVMEHRQPDPGAWATDPASEAWWWHARILTTCGALVALDVAGFAHYLATVGVQASSLVFGFEVGPACGLPS